MTGAHPLTHDYTLPVVYSTENDSSDEPQAKTSPHSYGAHWILLTGGGGGA